MGKVKRLFSCSACGRVSGQWAGRCPGCAAWGTVDERPAQPLGSGPAGPVLTVADLSPPEEAHRISTGFAGVDRVLGGGLVRGSVVLLAGAPGIGKSTFLLQLASRLTDAGHPCLIASGEEARAQIADRAARLRIAGDRLTFAPGRELGEVLSTTEAHGPAVLIVDSVHTIRDSSQDTLAGGPAQVRHCVDALVGLAKRRGITTLLVGHVTKAGDLAGPRTVEHAVDVLLTFEGEARSARRILVGGKNRFGPEGEVAWFEMGPDGLQERSGSPAPSAEDAEPGCAVAIAMTGRRALAVEVQALVVSTEGPPRRQVAGLDPRRFHIVAAVADRAVGGRLARSELYGTSAGGFRLDDPSADLAMAVALASSAAGVAVPPATGYAAEVALSGALRPVGGIDQRLAAASAAGLRQVLCSANEPGLDRVVGGVRMVRAEHLRQALHWLPGGATGLGAQGSAAAPTGR